MKNSYLEQYLFSLVLESIYLLNSFSKSLIKISSKFGELATDSEAFNLFLVDLNQFFKWPLNASSNSKYGMLNLNWYGCCKR